MEEKTTVPVIKTNGINEIEINDNTKISFLELGKKKVFKTSEEAKWVGIDVADIPTVKALPLHAVSDKWVSWKKSIGNKQHISKYGIGKQYTIANAIKTRAVHKKDIHSGVIRYYEAFTKEPNFQSGAYLVAVATPKILSACFAVNKNQVLYPSTYKNSNVLTYKSAIKLFINTHRIPDYTKPYHNFALFEIDIYDTQSGKVTEEPLRYYQRMNPNVFSANTLTEINIEIDEAWREKSKHKKGVKTYYAKIKTILFKNEDAFIGEKVADIKEDYLITANPNPRNNHAYFKHTNKFKGVAPNHDTIGVVFTSEDEAASSYTSFGIFKGRDVNKGKQHALKYEKETLGVYDTSQGTVLEGQQATFQVRYDDMEVILQKYEASKNNMLVAVGDIAYSQKSNEPCKLSKITINHKSRKQPFVLFDEDQKTKKVTDNTNLIFEIVAGQKKEEITITAQGLVIQDYQEKGKKPRCLGVTVSKTVKNGAVKVTKEKHRNDEKFIHKSSKEVFNMQQAFMLFPERIKEKNANLATSVGNEILDIARQNLSYEHTDNGIKLQVGYFYNKTFDTVAETLLGENMGEKVNNMIDKAWIFKYFFLTKDQAQTYFVPISTCRYPNQMAVIKVYPQINWGLSFSFGGANPRYKEEWQKELANERKELIKEIKAKPFDRNNPLPTTKKKQEKLNKLNIKVGLYAKYDKSVINLTPATKKITDFINKFAEAKEILDLITGNSMSKSQQQSIYKNRVEKIAQKKGQKFAKKLARLPITITVYNPSLSFGMTWGRKNFTTNQDPSAPMSFDIFFKANPLFKMTGSLNLITCAEFLPLAGQVIAVADIVLNVVGVEPVFKIEATGDIKADLTTTIIANKKTDETKTAIKVAAGLKIMVEASVTMNPGMASFMFSGGEMEALAAEETYRAYAEAGFTVALSTGVAWQKGPYVEPLIEFSGLVARAKIETKVDDYGNESGEPLNYIIIKKTTVINKTYYL